MSVWVGTMSCRPQNLDKPSVDNYIYMCILSTEGRPEPVLQTTHLPAPSKSANLAWPESI